MPDRFQILLENYKNLVREILGSSYASMVIYGSYARGDYDQDSDLDILILADVKPEEIGRYSGKIYDLSYDLGEEYGVEINPVIQSKSVYEYWKQVYPFFMNIDREGVAV